MKKEIIFYLVILMVPMLLNAKIVGYHDRDKNHINDLFKDANGDGINDITGKRYKHRFPFIDKNKDGINDFFIDTNGDGINDVKSKLYRKLYPCIDYNNDGINDITGKRYKKMSKKIKTLLKVSKWVDVDRNSSENSKTRYKKSTARVYGKGKYDTFIDKNKNGIDDRRESGKAVIVKKEKTNEEK